MPDSEHRESAGFTLIELIVATAISALVISIVSVCFSFALRVWQMTTNAKPDQTFRMAELLQRQLAESDPTPINFEQRRSPPVYRGCELDMFHNVSFGKSDLHGGARWRFATPATRGSQVLSYSELVINPYRPAALEKFAAGRTASGEKSEVRSYKVDIA